MIVSSIPSILRATAALPGAGAAAALTPCRVNDADEITLWVLYQCNAGVANGAPTLRVIWSYPFVPWGLGIGQNVGEGVIINAGTLVTEDWPFATPGAAGAQFNRSMNLKVPAGATFFQGTIRETGTPATPGNAGVMVTAGIYT